MKFEFYNFSEKVFISIDFLFLIIIVVIIMIYLFTYLFIYVFITVIENETDRFPVRCGIYNDFSVLANIFPSVWIFGRTEVSVCYQ